jgi:hypothetical protein
LQGEDEPQATLFDLNLPLDESLEEAAQRFTALILNKQSQPLADDTDNDTTDYQTVDNEGPHPKGFAYAKFASQRGVSYFVKGQKNYAASDEEFDPLRLTTLKPLLPAVLALKPLPGTPLAN